MEWKIKKLGDICENLDSRRVPITKKRRVLGEVPYYGASGIVDYVKDYLFDEELLLVSEDGANLLARTYPIAFSVSGKSWVNNHAHALKFSESTIQQFVEYYLNSISLKDYISGMAQPKLNQKSLNSIPVPIPQLADQKRIVALLDTVFADLEKTRAKTEQNLKNARELFDSYLQQVFSQKGEGWAEGTFNNILEIKSGRNQKAVLDANGEYPIYGSAGKIMGWANSYICEENTTIIGRKGTINSPVYIKTKFWNVDTAFGLVAGENLDKKFLFYFCKSFDFSKLDKGTTLPSLVKKDLVKIVMPLPMLDEQINLSNKLDELSLHVKKIEEIYRTKLAAIAELKKSILQKAFNGELSPTTKHEPSA